MINDGEREIDPEVCNLNDEREEEEKQQYYSFNAHNFELV